MKVKEESEKVGLKLNIQNTKIIPSSPITSWQIDGETMETVIDFILGGSKITADGDCSHEIKTLAPWKKSYDLDSILKNQRYYFANKGPSCRGCDFSSGHVWMWQLDYKESWVLNDWCFWTVVLEKTLESPLDWRRSNQSTLKEISPEYSLEGLMLKLKLQYFDHLMRRTDWFEKTLMLGKIEGRRRRGWDGWMASLTQWTWVWVNSGNWWWTGKPSMLQSIGLQRVQHDWAPELNWFAEYC